MFKNRPKTIWNTRTIVIMGLMIALSIVLTRFFAINIGPTVRLSLGSIAAMLTGMWFGPVAGFIAGAASDVIGLMIAPSGAWLPLITLSAGLWGAIPALLTGLIKGDKRHRTIMTVVVVLITSVICQTVTTIALLQAFGMGFLPGRIIQLVASTPIYCILVTALYFSPVTKMVYERERPVKTSATV